MCSFFVCLFLTALFWIKLHLQFSLLYIHEWDKRSLFFHIIKPSYYLWMLKKKSWDCFPTFEEFLCGGHMQPKIVSVVFHLIHNKGKDDAADISNHWEMSLTEFVSFIPVHPV